MQTFVNNLIYFIVGITMLVLMLAVGLIPMLVVAYYNLPEFEFLARIMGCIISIPMLRLSFTVCDKTFNYLEG